MKMQAQRSVMLSETRSTALRYPVENRSFDLGIAVTRKTFAGRSVISMPFRVQNGYKMCDNPCVFEVLLVS